MQRRVCAVGVGLSDGPVTPGMSAVMLQAQAFRRALDDAGLEKSDIDGLASAGYGGMHDVARPLRERGLPLDSRIRRRRVDRARRPEPRCPLAP